MSSRGRVPVLRSGARRELALMVTFAVVTLVVVSVGAAFASLSVAKRQALDESVRSTRRFADLVVGPLLTGYLEEDPAGRLALEQAVAQRMADGTMTEVTVWRGDGTVMFCNDAEVVGHRVQPPPEVADALLGRTSAAFEEGEPEANGPTVADPTGSPSVPSPSTTRSSGHNRYVEVYVPLTVEGQQPLVFEAYYTYERVDHVADLLLRQTLPLVLGPLLVLQLIQIPVAISLARRLKRHEHDRAQLLERALTASDRERVRFAADLHDGPIQELAGISYALGAIAPSVPSRHEPLMGRVEGALQRSIASLRGLMTDLYPPDLHSGRLDESLRILVAPLEAAGVDVQLELDELPPLDQESTATLYRVARESLANTEKHAEASHLLVELSLVPAAPGAGRRVRLVVEDDGVGMEPDRLDRRREGHLGLRLLIDKVETIGGLVTVTSAAGRGTRLQVELPLRTADGDDVG